MNVFNIVYGSVGSGKTYFVTHCAKPSDIIFDNVGIEVIENVTLWNTFCKRYDDAMFWIVLDLTQVSMAQFNTIQMFFVKYGVVNNINIRLLNRRFVKYGDIMNSVDNMASLTPKECNRFHELFDPLCTTYDTYVIKHPSSPLIDVELIRTIITYAIRYNQSIDIHMEDGNLCEYTITICGMCLMSAYADWINNERKYCINNM